MAEIVAPGNHKRVLLEIFGDDARLAGSVQQRGGSDILQATADGMQLRLQLDVPPATFEGAMQPEGSQIVGKWTQDGDDCWLVFRRL